MGQKEICEILSTVTSIPHKSLTAKQPKKDISKQHGKQAKTGEVERNYKMHMFADPVFTNPSRSIFRFMSTLREIRILPINLTI